jgi:hypothetical protein
MRGLFDFVDQQLSETDCDGSLRYTLMFLGQEQLAVDPVVKWLQNGWAMRLRSAGQL